VLPLPVAEMDFALAPPISAALIDAVQRSDTGYALADRDLPEALANFARARWDWTVNGDAVRVATDVGVGCVDLLRVLCEPGDSVVFNPPVYPPFFHWIDETRTRPVEVPLRLDDDNSWRLDLDRLADAFAERPKVFLLCNPHNPVGRVHTREELGEVLRLSHEYGVTVLSDEIHAPLVLPGATFTPFLTIPGAADAVISLVSASKAWNLAGLKCALLVSAGPKMTAVIDRRPMDARWRVGHLGVLASVAAFREGMEWLDALIATLEQRRTQLGRLLEEHLPAVHWSPPQATYLAWLDCRYYGDGEIPQLRFLEQGQVALEPGPAFGQPGSGWVRLNFATSPGILDEAIRRMASAVT
jgi:cystathionine beta-lyase